MDVSGSKISSWCLLILASALFSCSSPRNVSAPEPPEEEGSPGPRICFLTYQLKRDSPGSAPGAELISMIMKDGSIKEAGRTTTRINKDDLELLVLDANQAVLSRQHIPNPLDRFVEYANDTRQLEGKMIHLDSIQFNARVPVDPGAASIVLNRIAGENKEDSLLLKTLIL